MALDIATITLDFKTAGMLRGVSALRRVEEAGKRVESSMKRAERAISDTGTAMEKMAGVSRQRGNEAEKSVAKLLALESSLAALLSGVGRSGAGAISGQVQGVVAQLKLLHNASDMTFTQLKTDLIRHFAAMGREGAAGLGGIDRSMTALRDSAASVVNFFGGPWLVGISAATAAIGYLASMESAAEQSAKEGGNQSHAHGFNGWSDERDHRPPWYALAYIMKL